MALDADTREVLVNPDPTVQPRSRRGIPPVGVVVSAGLRRVARAAGAARARLRDPDLVWLLLTVGFVAPFGGAFGPSVPVPVAGLDPSWITALNIAHGAGVRFGSDAVFTYGPLGFMDVPLVVSRSNMVLGLLFAALAAASLWLALRHALIRALAGSFAAPVAAVMVVLLARVALPSTIILSAFGYVGFAIVGGTMTRWAYRSAALAAVSAILVLVKFSEGLALLGIAGLVTLFTALQKPLVRGLAVVAVSGASFVVTFVVAWLLAGQSLGDVVSWLHGSLSVSSGYTDAMAVERSGGAGFIAGIVVTVIVLALAPRVSVERSRLAVAGSMTIALAVLYLGWKEGFVRHDTGHEYTLFVQALPLVAACLICVRSIAAKAVLLTAVLALAGTSLSALAPRPASQRLVDEYRILTDATHQQTLLDKARVQAQQAYRLPETLIAGVGLRPVSIDPLDVSLAWAYRLNWRPVPVFQNYSAYTPYLDERNASALADAPDGAAVLRRAGGGLDGRNPLWDPPRYTQALICHYVPERSEGVWMLLGKIAASRCGDEQTVTSEHVRAGQQIDVPAAPDVNTMVVMHFTPSGPGLLTKAWWALAKPGHPLHVTAGGRHYRLPRKLADGPLIVRMAPSAGWADGWDGATAYQQVAFSDPGVVRFTFVRVG